MKELKKHEVSKLGRKLLLIASFSSIDEQSSNILISVVQSFGKKKKTLIVVLIAQLNH